MLELSHLHYRYPDAEQDALVDINFKIQQGQCIGLLGANGAGKTTLLSLIAQLITPSAGQLRWQQQPSLGLVPQTLAFYAKLSSQENLHLFADLYLLKGQQRQQQLSLAIEAAQLESLLHKKAGQLSGGQQRRLNFALGILAPAQLFLFDEVTVGVDSVSRQHLLNAIKQLKQSGKSIIYTSHYLPEIEQIAERVILLNAGKVQLDIALAEQPSAHNLVIEWASGIPNELVKLCQQQQLDFQQQHNSLIIHALSQPQWTTLLTHISHTTPAPIRMNYSKPSLEQLYLQVSGGQL